jgi:hypothetical protein
VTAATPAVVTSWLRRYHPHRSGEETEGGRAVNGGLCMLCERAFPSCSGLVSLALRGTKSLGDGSATRTDETVSRYSRGGLVSLYA